MNEAQKNILVVIISLLLIIGVNKYASGNFGVSEFSYFISFIIAVYGLLILVDKDTIPIHYRKIVLIIFNVIAILIPVFIISYKHKALTLFFLNNYFLANWVYLFVILAIVNFRSMLSAYSDPS